MKKLLISAIALVAMMSQASFAQTPAPDQLAQRTIERRAVEAVDLGHAGRQLRPHAPGNADQDPGQSEPDDLLGPAARLAATRR